MVPDRTAIATAIADACRRLHARGLLAGAEGNVSVLLPDGDLLITRTGADKATVTAADVVVVHGTGPLHHDGADAGDRRDGSGRDITRRPSSEVGMHRACYAARGDVRAVVHAHPPAASGFATAGIGLPADVLPELPVVVGPVALVPYGRPGTPALEEAMAPFLASHEAFLLANHGVTTLGRSLEDALLRMESVEQAARILLAARLLGGSQHLDASEAAALSALHTLSQAAPPG
jgi:L-fuculose-phosphate aldolase